MNRGAVHGRLRRRATGRLGFGALVATSLAAASLVVGGVLDDATIATAQTDGEVPIPSFGLGSLGLTLIDHSIDVPAGGELILTYRIDGALADAELLFIDANEASPTTTTQPVESGDELPPEPVPISVDVVIDDRLDETADLIGRLGPTATRSSFADPPDGIRILDVRPAIEVSDDGTAVLTLVVPTDTSPSEFDRLGIDQPGLYPLLVELQVGGVVVARHGTVLHRVGPGPTPPPIGLAAITAVSQPTTLLEDDALLDRIEAAARITEAAAVTSMPLTISIPPRVVDGLTVGTSAGAIAAESLRDDVLQSLPATPFDISSAVAIGRDDAFVRQLTSGEERLQAAIPGVSVRRDVWLVDRPISSEAAALMRTLGVRLLAIPETIARATLDPLPDPLPVDRLLAIGLPDGTTLPAIVIDDADSPFTPAATDAVLRDATPIEWAIEDIARRRLAVEETSTGPADLLAGRGHLLATPDLTPPDARLLDELVRIDARTSLFRIADAGTFVSTVDTIPIDDAGLAPTLPDVAGPSLAERVETIEATGLVVANVSSMLAETDERPGQWLDLLDALVSTAYTDEQVETVVDAITSEADRLTGSVVAPEPFSLTLTSREERIPIAIESTADEPLLVRVELTSERLQFPDGDPEVVLAPNTTTEIEIPVVARTNGTTSVELRIVTPLGGPLTDPVRITTRVQALSGIAQLVTAVLVILLATWWFTHWRARRREQNGAGDEAPTATG